MECICPYCGKKSKSSELCFDLSEQFKRWKNMYFDQCTQEERERFSGAFDGLVNCWHNQGHGPTFFSEAELREYSGNLTDTGAQGVSRGMLEILAPKWKEKLHEKRDEVPAEYRDLMEFMLGDSFASRKYMLRMEVQHYKEGDGDVRITAIRDAKGNMIADQRHCPHCGGVMSYWAGRYPEVVLTVLGGPRISKSTALAACADVFVYDRAACAISWQSHGVRTVDGSEVREKGDKSWIQFETDCLEPYSKNRKVAATKTGNTEAIPRFSVLVRIGQKTNLILTVVDLPGEYSLDRDRLGVSENIFTKYQEFYRNVDCVWYCTDVVELKQLNVSEKQELNKYGYDEGRRLTPTDELVARIRQLSALFRKDVPVVFLLGKSDTVEAQGRIRSILYQDNYRPGASSDWLDIEGKRPPILRAKDFCDRAQQLRAYLVQQNARLIECFEEHFPVHTFLATSNYGHGFVDTEVEKGVPTGDKRPFQTEAPFLWMLAMLGYLPVSEGNTEYYTVDREGRKDADQLTWENLGMYGRSAGGYRSHGNRHGGGGGLLGGLFGRR